MSTPLDCLVIGAGPAGLTAAIYLARFHLGVQIVDAGKSRAALIPMTHNHAGYPGGIKGTELLKRMHEQAAGVGAAITQGVIEGLEQHDGLFAATLGDQTILARTVLLATGVVNNPPPISPELHGIALERGLLRYCPICDGYEATDQNIGVIGTGTHGHKEAIFLRSFSSRVTLIAPGGPHAFHDTEREALEGAGVAIIDGPCQSLRLEDRTIIVPTPSGDHGFDTLYPALGSVIRSELAVQLGAEASADGCLVVDDHQRTSIAGLYAAGDVAKGLDQISHAMGEAGVAATTIRNDLAENRPLRR
ncbi:NAD(P)/FAD-dependent oxidoreductase [Sphingomonas sp. AOB5]|uniref:NAD(P)/FAD-dependent oxidoreductase n=1 Tax=Sphingomonas sp. AOB5 TaxID=3034017 RepID=UPI0023F955B2|nr:NAD(P)/FAD-dependent oxidoreductase [Sphingomonas sp. AOB5]MDF7773656.1 NAD(P)/FAD-dependent oxidoreductase [Sphingomonas sp. AOB5]